MSSSLAIELAGENLVLDARGSVWIPSCETLVVADLHWGKEAAFQAAFVPVPSGATETTVRQLMSLITHYSARRVLILGDLVHAKTSLSDATLRIVQSLWEEHHTVLFELVEGNHDRSSRKAISRWPLKIHTPPWVAPPFCFVHDLESELPSDWPVEDKKRLAIGGHLHPVFRMPDNGQKLKCFVVRQNQLVLPAFGELTFGRPLQPQSPFEKGCRYFVTDGKQVLRVGSA